ncbi:MAG: hypothetical protein ABSF43_16580 [Rectinemataceae bacterium]
MDQEGAKVALDDQDPVSAPHLFENVAPGSHTISIHDVRVGDKFYAGVAEKVSVEAGKRLKLHPGLVVGKAKLRVEGIPDGSTLLIEGEEQSYTKNPSGKGVFESSVDAGFFMIEVVHGSKTWYKTEILGVNHSDTIESGSMFIKYSPELRNIKMNKKAEEWAGLDNMFGDGAGGHASNMNMPGSRIVGGTLCRDDKNLYIKMDFSNGNPVFNGNKIARGLNLRQDSQSISLETMVWNDNGEYFGHARMWVEKEKHMYDAGSFAAGSSFLEMRFPFSWFSKYFDSSKPIRANLYCWIGDPSNCSYTQQIDIVIGK